MTHTLPTTDPAAPPRDAARLLRLVLRIDSVSTAVMGVVLIAAGGPLGSATGMPVAFSAGFGIYQIGGAAALALIAGYPAIPPGLARAAIAVNAVSAVGCVVTAFGDMVPLTGFGVAFMLIGALIVTVYAALEYAGLRRMTASA
ncbi:hypothetical protein ACFYYR_05690 [Streptomyces sp. NPDC001922]|uniref:hypothetical protein n=1 Tax=Streptomyces sp. NPDC001922 TaxID=3364624 RepID=UPI0036AB72AD